LVEPEEANSAMLFADPKIAVVASAQAVGHDDHFSLGQHLVDPTVEKRPHFDGDPKLLADFPRETGFWSFSGLEPSAWQFPLVALVLQQDDPIVLIENPFY
jgi:hypothetical protein